MRKKVGQSKNSMNLFNYLKVTESKFIFEMLIKEPSFMAKVISKKLLIIIGPLFL